MVRGGLNDMKTAVSNKNTLILTGFCLTVLVLLVSGIVLVSRNGSWLETAFEKKVKKVELINTMRVNLLASAEAEKSAVMADSDEESKAFAEQSVQASMAVEKARAALAQLMRDQTKGKEIELLEHFTNCWENLQKIDREILALAVRNTNLKALRLSFVPAGEAIRRLESALNQLMDITGPSPDALRTVRLASRVISDAKSIYMLQAPHIAETSDQAMDEMEAAMKRLDDQISKDFSDLRGLVDETGRPFLDAAAASYNDFREVNSQVIDLSRQNSNIKSFSISLGQKRKMTAQCLDSIAALEKAVNENLSFSATR